MANNDEDEFYSDDDLDALPADALSELELKAVRSTQQKNPSMTHGQLQQNHQSLPILFKASVQTLPVQPRYDGRKAQQYAQSVDYPQQPSSDYGNFDDEDLEADLLDAGDFTNLAEQGQTSLVEKLAGESTQREQWRQGRHSTAIGHHQPVQRSVAADSGYDEYGDEEMLDQPAVRMVQPPGNEAVEQQGKDVDVLQAQIEEA